VGFPESQRSEAFTLFEYFPLQDFRFEKLLSGAKYHFLAEDVAAKPHNQ
jgi:hypothetical protein